MLTRESRSVKVLPAWKRTLMGAGLALAVGGRADVGGSRFDKQEISLQKSSVDQQDEYLRRLIEHIGTELGRTELRRMEAGEGPSGALAFEHRLHDQVWDVYNPDGEPALDEGFLDAVDLAKEGILDSFYEYGVVHPDRHEDVCRRLTGLGFAGAGMAVRLENQLLARELLEESFTHSSDGRTSGQEALFQLGNEGLERIRELIPNVQSLSGMNRYALRRVIERELQALVNLRHIREDRKREDLLSNAKTFLENMVLDSD